MSERERLQKALALVNEAHIELCMADDTVATAEGWDAQLVNAADGIASAYGYLKTALERAK